MTPPTSLSHPVAASSAGVQFQSPPMNHGPLMALSTPAMLWRRSRLHLAPMPTVEVVYTDPPCTPLLVMDPISRMMNLPPKWARFSIKDV
jgi:hypothetical protein